MTRYRGLCEWTYEGGARGSTLLVADGDRTVISGMRILRCEWASFAKLGGTAGNSCPCNFFRGSFLFYGDEYDIIKGTMASLIIRLNNFYLI